MSRVRARVEGTVQGVGFRPYVYRLASELGLNGWVLNDSHGVLLEVEAPGQAVEAFLARLPVEAPPLASVERVSAEPLPPVGLTGFAIRESPHHGEPRADVTPDSATCEDCLAELFDPADRRYRYPFVNCTNCGPRFTIVRDVPYDRPYTTMSRFQMCAACQAEYDDPADRRFHAQPNACPECGPSVRLVGLDPGPDAVGAAARALLSGAVVAVKGIGGFHLACRADDETAVARLRARKHREDKPFAVMAPDPGGAQALVDAGPEEVALLLSRERPIVLAARRAGAPVAASVAPRSRELGVMLPYSPLHHLLLRDAGTALVLTSGNVSDEPIAFRDEDALERLGGIADAFLVHDRPIRTRTDDSVVRAGSVLRRSRGYVPASMGLPRPARRDLLACGAHLKNTFCVARGGRAWVGHHIGDLETYETLLAFTEGIQHFERLFAVRPEVVAHDLHPEYLSTKYALERDGVELMGVQHHHAHLAAVLAEHGEAGPAVGAIYDGAGLGTDGTVWGGEILHGDLLGFERVAHLHPVRLPGGEAAVRQPWRMACAWLVEALGQADPLPGVDAEAWDKVAALARGGLASPVTTSAGRLFDAVAALCGVRTEINYEGQAAIELEALCDPRERGTYPLPGLDARETITALVSDLGRGTGAAVAAARFHNSLAAATAAACEEVARATGTRTVVLAGGVFHNRRLLRSTSELLSDAGLRVLVPRLLPAGDGGLSFGQAAVAAARSDGGA